MSEEFRDAALVLVGHGSTTNAEAAAVVHQHAEALRRRGLFSRILEVFIKQAPRLGEVLREVTAPRVFLAPLFLAEGYFTQEVIPRELEGRARRETAASRWRLWDGRTLYYCRPVGRHERMAEVLLGHARQVVAEHPFPCTPAAEETALFIAGHGTGRNLNPRRVIEDHAAGIRQRRIYAEVHAVFMEEEPRIGDCWRMAAAKNLVVVPFFMSNGRHAREDIPQLLGEPAETVRQRLRLGQAPWRNPTERHCKRLWYAEAVGTDPLITEVILACVQEAAAEE